MKSKLVWENAGERTFILVLESGDEAFAAITAFAAGAGLKAASLTAIGAFENGRGGIGDVKLAKRGHATWPLEWGHFFALRRRKSPPLGSFTTSSRCSAHDRSRGSDS